MADRFSIGRALQGFSAGVAGQGQQFLQSLDDRRRDAAIEDSFAVQRALENKDPQGARGLLLNRLENIQRLGGDPSDTIELLQKFDAGDLIGVHNEVSAIVELAQAKGLLKAPAAPDKGTSLIQNIEATGLRRGTPEFQQELSRQLERKGGAEVAELKTFRELTRDLSTEQELEARLIKLGIAPRAVGSAVQTISEQGIAEEIGDVEATIAERKKFGELTGSSRSKSIDKGFERITKIDTGLRNIDRAIDVIKSGAGTGAIQRLLPSIRAASVELDNIQGRLALDVIGGVTFGALSKGELDLAKQVALPTGLDGPELVQHLEERKAAQLKLRDYFSEQIDFLDQGGTVASFLRSKERDQTTQQAAPEAPAQPGGIQFLGFE